MATTRLNAQFVRYCVASLRDTDASVVADALRTQGAVANQHCGRKPSDFTKAEEIEWYAGQVLATLEGQGPRSGLIDFIHISTVCSVCEKFTGIPL